MNTIDKPELFYFDVKELKKALKICVKSCPKRTLSQPRELKQYFTETGAQFCKYDYNMDQLDRPGMTKDDKIFNTLGPCPSLPVLER